MPDTSTFTFSVPDQVSLSAIAAEWGGIKSFRLHTSIESHGMADLRPVLASLEHLEVLCSWRTDSLELVNLTEML